MKRRLRAISFCVVFFALQATCSALTQSSSAGSHQQSTSGFNAKPHILVSTRTAGVGLLRSESRASSGGMVWCGWRGWVGGY